jgi:hypothetical protein
MKRKRNILIALNEIQISKDIKSQSDIYNIFNSKFNYLVKIRQKGCCCVTPYDYANTLSELKEIYSEIDKDKYEITIEIKLNNEWLDLPSIITSQIIDGTIDILEENEN